MARSFTLDGVAVKTRHPLAPLGLGLITLGLYNLYWYYAINREMRDLGEDVNPAVALLAVTFGAILIVPPFVSLYNTAERIRRTQEGAGVSDPLAPVLALVLLFVPIANMFVNAYLQSALNRAYERAGGMTTARAATSHAAA